MNRGGESLNQFHIGQLADGRILTYWSESTPARGGTVRRAARRRGHLDGAPIGDAELARLVPLARSLDDGDGGGATGAVT